MDYKEKKEVADAYLTLKAGISWDELSDINSLHDAETKDEIIALCDDRLSESGFPDGVEDELTDDDEDEGELDYINLDGE
jgi:hypothetical protein